MKKLYYLIILTVILGLVLTGCFLSNVGQVPATEQSGITYLTKGTESVPDSFPLYAGQDMLVGEVLVWDDGGELCVKYQLSDDAILAGWLLYETHLEAATSLAGIPQKNGNPPPGQFRYGDDELGGVEETEPYCIDFEDIIGFEEGADLCDAVIAAHAVIEKTECEIVVEAGSDFCVSDTDTMVVAGNVGGAVYPENAVLAHKPGDAGSPYGYVWDTWPDHAFDAAAEWIWESQYVVHPILGDDVTFEREFQVPGIPAGGTLYVACDNGFAVELNGVLLGSYNLFLYPNLGNLMQDYVNTTDWKYVQSYDLAANLIQGTNTLTIIGVNEYMNPDDVNEVGSSQMIGDVYYNPGGVIFEFDVDWDEVEECTTYSETAWAAGFDFPGRNWATYFTYNSDMPTISSEDLAGPFTAGVLSEFTVTTVNPECGFEYSAVLFNYTIFGINPSDILVFEYYYYNGTNWVWGNMPKSSDGSGNVIGYFGDPTTGFPMSAPYSETTTFSIKITNSGTYTVVMTLDNFNDPYEVLALFTQDVVFQ